MELWYLHLIEHQVPLRHFRLGWWGLTACGPPPWLQRHSNQRGGGSEIQRASSRLHEGCPSSGFRRLLWYNLTCGIADQSSTLSIWCSIIYTSVKPMDEKKAVKARPHSLRWNFNQRQRLGGRERRSRAIYNWLSEYSQPLNNSISTLSIGYFLSLFRWALSALADPLRTHYSSLGGSGVYHNSWNMYRWKGCLFESSSWYSPEGGRCLGQSEPVTQGQFLIRVLAVLVVVLIILR